MTITRNILMIAGAAILVTGCVPSLHPFFTRDTIVFEDSLIGVWSMPDDGDSWTFTKSDEEDNAYTLVIDEGDDDTGTFLVHMVKLDKHLYLDLAPHEDQLEDAASDFYKCHLVPAHTVLDLIQIEPALIMAAMDPSKVEKIVDADPAALKHEIIEDDRLVITASTPDFQNFVTKHRDTIFGDPTEPMTKRAVNDDDDDDEDDDS